jgi:hypothetical protein
MEFSRTRRSLPLLLALFVALLASACSWVSLGYGNAPTLLSWRAAAYFDLDTGQRQELRSRLQTVHEWHRAERLAELVAIVDEVQARLDRKLSIDDGDWLVEVLLAHYRGVVERAIDESADLLGTVRADQIAALERRLDEENAEFADKWTDPPAGRVRMARFKRILGHAEDWLGRLEPSQRRWLQARLDTIPADYRAWHAYRRQRAAEFVALIAAPGPAFRKVAAVPVDRAALRRFALERDVRRSQAEHAAAEDISRAYIRLAVDLINDAAPEQRERLRRRLEGYATGLASQLQ